MKFLLMFLVTIVVSFAQALTPEQITIRTMIQEIKQAPAEQRFIKMNAFKQKLREMNAQARKEAIVSLQKSLNSQLNKNKQEPIVHPVQFQENQKQLQIQQQTQKQYQIHKNVSGTLGKSKR